MHFRSIDKYSPNHNNYERIGQKLEFELIITEKDKTQNEQF